MQIDPDTKRCPSCGALALRQVPVIHHMVCAYVGPDYDFPATEAGRLCPKCRRELHDGVRNWEVVGTSAHCSACKAEFVMSDPPPVVPGRET